MASISITPEQRQSLIAMTVPKLSTNTAHPNHVLYTQKPQKYGKGKLCSPRATTHQSSSNLPTCPLSLQYHQLLLLKAWHCLQMSHKYMLSLPLK